MRRVAGLVALSLTACGFAPDIGEGARIRCAVSSECPPGFTCSLEQNECIAAEVTGAPLTERVDRIRLDPDRPVRAGELVRVEVGIDNPLRAPPVVRALGADGALDLIRVGVTELGDHVYEAIVEGDTVDGPYEVSVELRERSGQLTRLPSGRFIEVDNLAPDVVAAIVSPTLAKPGDRIVVQVFLDEAARGGLLVEELALTLPPAESAATQLFFETVLPATPDPAGLRPLTLILTNLRDLAGNESDEITLDATLNLDDQAPVVELALDRPAVSDGAPLGLSWSSDEPVAVQVFLAGAPLCELVGAAGRCDGSIPFEVSEGDQTVLVIAEDAAGNSTSATLQLEIDRTAPRVIPETVTIALTPPETSPRPSVKAVTDGTTLDLRMAVNDVLGSPALQSVMIDGRPMTPEIVDDDVLQYSYRVGPDDAPNLLEAELGIEVRMVDHAGNEGVEALPLTLSLDRVPPAASNFDDCTSLVLLQAPHNPGGAQAELAAAVEPDVLVQVLDASDALVGEAELTTGQGVILLEPSASAGQLRVVLTDAAGLSRTGAVRNLRVDAQVGSALSPSVPRLPGGESVGERVPSFITSAESRGIGIPRGTPTSRRLVADTSPIGDGLRVIDSLRGEILTLEGDPGCSLESRRGSVVRSERWMGVQVPQTMLHDGALGFDPRLGRVLYQGGAECGSLETDELHVWDGLAWEQTPTTGATPPESSRGVLLFEPLSGDMIYLGSRSEDFESGNVQPLLPTTPFLLRGTAWRRVVDIDADGDGSPSSCSRFTVDENLQRVLAFGGCGGNRGPWVFEDETWRRVPLEPGPAPARNGEAIYFDRELRRTVLVDEVRGETWLFDGRGWQDSGFAPPTGTVGPLAISPPRHGVRGLAGAFVLENDGWRLVSETTPPPRVPLDARSDPLLGYDPVAGEVVISGGRDGFGDWADSAFVLVGDQVSVTTGAPGCREQANFVSSPQQGLLLVGGVDVCGLPADNNTYRRELNTWRIVGDPPPIDGSFAAVDHPLAAAVVTDGASSLLLDPSDGTWKSDGSGTAAPPPGGAVWDDKARQVVLYGGPALAPAAETYFYRPGVGWVAGAINSDTSEGGARLLFDSARQRVLAVTSKTVIYELSPPEWRVVGDTGETSAVVYDGGRDRMIFLRAGDPTLSDAGETVQGIAFIERRLATGRVHRFDFAYEPDFRVSAAELTWRGFGGPVELFINRDGRYTPARAGDGQVNHVLSDPDLLHLRANKRVLVEVRASESELLTDSASLRLEVRLPPKGWSCRADRFLDGTCDLDCGAADDDCGGSCGP